MLLRRYNHTFRIAALRWLALIFTASPLMKGKEDNCDTGAPHSDYVVLLHGLGRTALSMKRIEWRLEKEGYQVINVSYPSTRLSVPEAAAWLSALIEKDAPDQSVKIHFVTHSLGGIVLRQYLADYHPVNLGRVVMLAPPNQGSELAERLKGHWFFRLCTGPAGAQLGTGTSSVPTQLGPATFELGVLAGNRSLNPILSTCFPGPNDGKVSVESTRLQGMQDFLTFRRTHTWMMWHSDVIGAILCFLKIGKFQAA